MSAPKEASSAAAKRPVTRRGREAGTLWMRLGPTVWVVVLIFLTVGAKWSTGKVQ